MDFPEFWKTLIRIAMKRFIIPFLLLAVSSSVDAAKFRTKGIGKSAGNKLTVFTLGPVSPSFVETNNSLITPIIQGNQILPTPDIIPTALISSEDGGIQPIHTQASSPELPSIPEAVLIQSEKKTQEPKAFSTISKKILKQLQSLSPEGIEGMGVNEAHGLSGNLMRILTGEAAQANSADPVKFTPQSKALLAQKRELKRVIPSLASPSPISVNMIVGIKRPGFGDIASNLRMAQMIRERDPGLDLRFWVSQDVVDSLKTLVPEFDETKGVQTIDGIAYYLGFENLMPQADYFLGFSLKGTKIEINYAKDIYIPEHHEVSDYELISRIGNSPMLLHFQEYGGSVYQVEGTNKFGRKKRIFHLQSGPTSSGLYISDQRPSLDSSKSNLVDLLQKQGLQAAAQKVSDFKVGYAYSEKSGPAKMYIRAIANIAASNPSENYLLFVKSFKNLNLGDLPQNLEIILLNNTPLRLNEAIVAASDLPLLITGDVSMTFAIEYGKVFMYETQTWKRKSIAALLEKLSLDPSSQEKAKLLFDVPEFYDEGYVLKIGEVLKSDKFQTDFIAALEEFQQEASLPEFVLRFIAKAEEDKKRGHNLVQLPTKQVRQMLVEYGITVKPTLTARFISFVKRMVVRASEAVRPYLSRMKAPSDS